MQHPIVSRRRALSGRHRSRSPDKAGRLVVPTLLSGVSARAGLHNSQSEGKLRVLKAYRREPRILPRLTRCDISADASLLEENRLSEAAFEHVSDGVHSTAHSIKRRHEEFKPVAASELARRALFGGGQGSPDGDLSDAKNKKVVAEDLLDRFEIFKYVRKIEPELAPLDWPENSYAPRDQALVKFNATTESIGRWSKDERERSNGARVERRNAHQRDVKAMKQKRVAEMLAHKRADAERSTLRALPAEEEHADDEATILAGKWLKWLQLGSIVAFAHEVNRRKLEFQSISDVEPLAADEESEEDPQARAVRRMTVVQCMWKTRGAIRGQRDRIDVVSKKLFDWKACGPIVAFMRRSAHGIRRIQRWWRVCLVRLRAVRLKVSKRWLRLEQRELTQEIKKNELLMGPRGGSQLPLADKLLMEMVEEKVRLNFIARELRARRYALLPRIRAWEADMRLWRGEVEQWRETRRALGILGHPMRDQVPPPHWPPKRPQYLPPDGQQAARGDEEVLEMWRRARLNPYGGGWAEPWLSQASRPCAPGSQQTAEVGNHAKAAVPGKGSRPPEPLAEDLRLFGVDLDSMPGVAGGGPNL